MTSATYKCRFSSMKAMFAASDLDLLMRCSSLQKPAYREFLTPEEIKKAARKD